MDGLVMHMCFKEEYLAETDRMMEHFQAYQGRELGEKELDEFFFGKAEESAYRRLLIARMDKPPYSPDKSEFLKYEDENYREENSAEKQLKRYLARNYRRNFGKVADKLGITANQCINDFVEEIYQHTSDRGSLEPKDPENLTVVPGSTLAAEGLKEIEEDLKRMGIQVDTQQTATEVSSFSYPNDPCGSGKKFKKCCGK